MSQGGRVIVITAAAAGTSTVVDLRRESAPIGSWVDSSAETPAETVDVILDNLEWAPV